jgi:hypothetical protein
LANPNRCVQIDTASSAAGSTKCFTFSDTSSRSMHEKSAWKYPCQVASQSLRTSVYWPTWFSAT